MALRNAFDELATETTLDELKTIVENLSNTVDSLSVIVNTLDSSLIQQVTVDREIQDQLLKTLQKIEVHLSLASDEDIDSIDVPKLGDE